MFEKLILNPYVKNALKQYMDKGQKNAQHLILSGPQGTGKRTCADRAQKAVQISWHTFSWTSDLISHSIPAQIFSVWTVTRQASNCLIRRT